MNALTLLAVPIPRIVPRATRLALATGAFAALAALAAAATVNLNPTADIYVRDGAYSGNNYNDTTLVVKDGDVDYNRNALLKFDLSGINGIVTGAKLKLYAASKEGGSTSVPIRVHQLSDSWTEAQTWSNAPAPGTVLHSIDITDVALPGWREYTHADLTSYVAAQLTGDKIVSFALTGNGVNYGVTFDSRTGTNSPVLEVTYDAAETHTLLAVEDAYVRDGTVSPNNYATTNYGTATTLEVKNGDPGFNRRALFKFNTGTLTGQVIRARLRVYVSNRENSATIPVSVAPVDDDSWRETSSPNVTWSNQPAHGTALASQSISANGWAELDVTNYVDLQVAGDRTVSLKLLDTATTNPKYLHLHSRENTNKPQLVIDLVPAPVTLQSATLDAYRDAYVRSDSAGTAFGTGSTLIVKGQSNAVHETYLRFNLGIVYGSVQGAALKLHVTSKDSGTIPVDVYAISNDSWFEKDTEICKTINGELVCRNFYGLDWNNKPSAGTLIGTINVSSTGAVELSNSTALDAYIASENAAGDRFASFLLKTTATGSTGVVLSSREGANSPKLDVDWQPGLKAFPEAGGPGAASRGAYTTTSTPAIVRVTNRNNSGTGSFREAVMGNTPAVVVFDVGGQFEIEDEVQIGSYKTIIGESAPEPVTFRGKIDTTNKNKRLAIRGSHVIITGVRVRPGVGRYEDGIFVTRGDNDPLRTDIMVAWCSMSWTGDELSGLWNGGQRITYQYNMMGECLEPTSSVNNKGFYFGSDYEDVEDVAFIRNFVSTIKFRFVGFKRTGSAVVAENLLYNWGSGDGAFVVYSNQPFGNTRMDILDNVLVAGPWTTNDGFTGRTFSLDQSGKYRVYGNVTPVGTDAVYTGSSYTVSQRVYEGSYTPTVSGTTAVESVVLSNAGARLAGALDSIDDRMVDLYLNNTARGSNPSHNYTDFDTFEPTLNLSARADTDSDGIYDAYETVLGVTAGSLNPHTAIVANDNLGSQWVGYTRIEHQRHWLRTGSLQ